MDKDFNSVLKELCEEKGMNQEELTKALGVTRQTISNCENNKRVPNKEMFEIIADLFNIDMNYLYRRPNVENRYQELFKIKNIFPVKKTTKKIPLPGTTAAEIPLLAEENFKDYIDVNKKTQADFCLRARGSSMINANILDGDIVLIENQSDVDDGEIAAVLIDGEATLKRVYKIGDIVRLRTENPSFKLVTLSGGTSVLILGKATYKLSKVL